MNNNTKQEYIAPELHCVLIEIEQGIAAGSATLTAGNNDEPVVEEWTDGGNIGNGGLDL
ncbi:hypothetical protein KRE40_02930 [Elizabethkingia meningoseptica]|uniref:hypothetical protein n=1 Tax=Elizabethkingia TaxID=308865 RepID=UPI000361260A|nr:MULTISPECIES: hypothetical protein [Elizabethkingia]EJK5329560.1 hypothetical protein [Elizabethkingia meningoseptica]MBG0513934.1 hypothetical protein [Elizabethkingia meningoseptica]MCL1675709.1 hypothetical protein [Elizabethkingia meningoseptica]MCL1686875.1 hypothetical protein [Elizabethkingia meningoseptica]MDE5430494.1 hypothetical protein [Elizabethkingia meningoseptica]